MKSYRDCNGLPRVGLLRKLYFNCPKCLKWTWANENSARYDSRLCVKCYKEITNETLSTHKEGWKCWIS